MISEFANATSANQQSISRTLGCLAYRSHQHGANEAIQLLMAGVSPQSPSFSANIETRRNCYQALTSILGELATEISKVINPSTSRDIYSTMLQGLLDYTTDARGDVGSWIRMVAIQGLVSITTVYFQLSETLPEFESWLPPSLFHKAVGAILKQGAERLDNVRQEAGVQLLRLVRHPLPLVKDKEQWAMKGLPSFAAEFLEQVKEDPHSWAEGPWLFPRIIKLVHIPEYRQDILMGMSLSIGSINESNTRPSSAGLVDFAKTLPVMTGDRSQLVLKELVSEIIRLGQKSSANNNVFIPILQTCEVLLEGGLLADLASESSGVSSVRSILHFAAKNADKIKNVQRILISMKITTGMLGVRALSGEAIEYLPCFLGHRFPKVRTATAETLYLVLQGIDLEVDESAEELLLETSWLQSEGELREAINSIVNFLKQSV